MADYAVFKAVNKRRREIYLGVTRLPVFETWAELRDARPSFADWRGEPVTVERLDGGISRKEALALLAKLVKQPPPKGWRLLK